MIDVHEMSLEEAMEIGLINKPIVTCVFLNGPAGSGKDHIAHMIHRGSSDVMHVKFSMVLKKMAAAGRGMEYEALEAMKDEKIFGENNDISFRDDQIAIYQFLEQRFGGDVLGRFVLEDIRMLTQASRKPGYVMVFSDAGRGQEVEIVAKKYGIENCLMIRLHREGYDFNDYRTYVHIDNMESWDEQNDGTPQFAEDLVQRIIEWVQITSLRQQGLHANDAKRVLELNEQMAEIQRQIEAITKQVK